MAQLRYDETYVVEMFDGVDLRLDGSVFDGRITKMHPRLGMVSVAFDDDRDTTRDGTPKPKSARVPVVDVDLIQRDI